MKTAVFAAAVATFLSTQVLADDAQPQDKNEHADQRIEISTLPPLPVVLDEGDSCALPPRDITCDRTAYDTMRKGVSEWFADEILTDAVSETDRVAKYSAPLPGETAASPGKS